MYIQYLNKDSKKIFKGNMAKYLVETYYNCTFKVSHYLDEINPGELKNLEKREDGKFQATPPKYGPKTSGSDPRIWAGWWTGKLLSRWAC